MMSEQRAVTRQDVAWLVALLLIFLLVSAAVNVPLATTFIIHRIRPFGPSMNVTGAEAAARGWPATTPHDQPWPAPTQWGKGERFGTSIYHVNVDAGPAAQNRFSMQVEHYGWPLPTLEKVQCWWDWNDPALKGPEPDPPLHVKWSGLILNPLILGGGLYLLLVAPVAAFLLGRRVARKRANQCVHCAYPLGAWDYCPECGKPVPRV
jgi:hypothetical protein